MDGMQREKAYRQLAILQKNQETIEALKQNLIERNQKKEISTMLTCHAGILIVQAVAKGRCFRIAQLYIGSIVPLLC